MTSYQFALVCDLVERVRRDIPVHPLPTCRAGHDLLASSVSRSVAVRIEQILDHGDEDLDELISARDPDKDPDEDDDEDPGEDDDEYEFEDDEDDEDDEDYDDEDLYDDEDDPLEDAEILKGWIVPPDNKYRAPNGYREYRNQNGMEGIVFNNEGGGVLVFLRPNERLAEELGFTFQHTVLCPSEPTFDMLRELANRLLLIYNKP